MRSLIQIRLSAPASDHFSPVMAVFKVKEILGHWFTDVILPENNSGKKIWLASVRNLLLSKPYLAIYFT